MRARRVCQYDSEGRLITTYPSVIAAAEKMEVSRQTIYNLLWQGTTFRYEKEEVREDAEEEEVIPLYGRLRHFALSLTHDEEWAKDLVQEAYLSYYEHYTTRKAKAYTFLCGCVKGGWLRDLKRQSLTIPISAQEFRIGGEDGDLEERQAQLQTQDSLLRKKMAECFQSIKTEKRRKRTKKLFNFYLQGMGSDEVAARMHIKPTSAKQEIIKMRKTVCDFFQIPVRAFTQKCCSEE